MAKLMNMVLGDIHGWAPGLFNYLVKTDTADIFLTI